MAAQLTAIAAVADRLRDGRERALLSQAELAVILGVSRSAIQAWEAGRAHPRPAHRRRIELFLSDVDDDRAREDDA